MTITSHCPDVNHTALFHDSPARQQLGDELFAGRRLSAGRRLVQPAAVALPVVRAQILAAARDQDGSAGALTAQLPAGFRDLRGLQYKQTAVRNKASFHLARCPVIVGL